MTVKAAGKSHSTKSSSGMLTVGSHGNAVATVQRELIADGFDPHGVDGSFGAKTRAAVIAFQRANGLVVDGKVGPQTLAALAHPKAKGGAKSQGSSAKPTSSGSVGATGTGKIGSLLSWAQSKVGVAKYAAINPFRFGTVPWDGKARKSPYSSTVYSYPKGTQVFDCSGFVVAAYRQIGVDLAKYGLTDSQSMAHNTSFLKNVTRSQLKPGDIITYAPENGVGHVVLYLGNGKCVECAGGVGVTVRNVDWGRVNGMKHVPGT